MVAIMNWLIHIVSVYLGSQIRRQRQLQSALLFEDKKAFHQQFLLQKLKFANHQFETGIYHELLDLDEISNSQMKRDIFSLSRLQIHFHTGCD